MRPKPHVLKPEDIQEYLAGNIPMLGLAKKYGVPRFRIYKAFKRQGIATHPKGYWENKRGSSFSDERDGPAVLQDFLSGICIDALSKKYHAHHRRIKRVLVGLGVNMTPRARKNGKPRKRYYPHSELRRKYSWERMEELYKEGFSTTDIARELGASRSAVLHALHARKVQMRSGCPTKYGSHLGVIRTMLADGYSKKEIMKATGLTEQTLGRAEASLGCPGRQTPRFHVWRERFKADMRRQWLTEMMKEAA